MGPVQAAMFGGARSSVVVLAYLAARPGGDRRWHVIGASAGRYGLVVLGMIGPSVEVLPPSVRVALALAGALSLCGALLVWRGRCNSAFRLTGAGVEVIGLTHGAHAGDLLGAWAVSGAAVPLSRLSGVLLTLPGAGRCGRAISTASSMETSLLATALSTELARLTALLERPGQDRAAANLLANCAAQAHGCPVLIEARRRGDAMYTRVTDGGRGIDVLPAQDVLDSGVRGARSEGQGLGLHLSRRMIDADGGSIPVRPRSVTSVGCTVEIQLAATSPQRQPVSISARRAS